MNGKKLLLAVLTGIAVGLIIQYVSSGQWFGWWIIVPIPLAILGEMFWNRERRRRDST